MSELNQNDFFEAEAIRPDLSGYQDRIVDHATDALVVRDKDVLLEAPTGSGKTAMLAVLADRVADQRVDGKVLILTHRRNLFRQMTGDADDPDLKKRLGEVAFWNGEKPGTIAEVKLGGVNQDPKIVVAMVETAANLGELGDLSEYTDIFIDEAHHASEESATREELGSYSAIIEMLPNAKVTGVTATSFRGDEGRLHPRLEAADRFIVGIEETEMVGRTVPVKTYVTKARLENGMTPNELMAAEAEGKLDRSASATMKSLKGDDYYERTLDEWERETNKAPTIGFADDVDEVKKITSLMNSKFGPSTAAMVHGGQSDQENNQAFSDYASGKVAALISCMMIGEGYDVPKTAVTASWNSSLKRGWQNQIGGRSVRSEEGKEFGIYMDFGTGTARHGALEEQHKLQTVRALAFSGSKKDAAVALSRSSPASVEGWNIVPGENRTLFFRREEGGRFQGYAVEKNVMSKDGRRVTSGMDSGRAFKRLVDRDGLALMSLSKIAGIVGEHVQSEAGYIARSGGLQGAEFVQAGKTELKSWSEELKSASKSTVANTGAQEREARVRAAVRGDAKSQVGFKAVMKALSESGDKSRMLRESVRLSGCMFDELSKSDSTPLGARDELASFAGNLMQSAKGRVTTKELSAYAGSVAPAAAMLGHMGLPKSVTANCTTLANVVKKTMQSVEFDKVEVR